MRYFLFLILILMTVEIYGQHTSGSDSIHTPTYDTTSIDIKSIDYFVFCKKTYKIPRDCEGQDQSNCCSFSSQIMKGEKNITRGQLGCNNGTSLFWTYYESENESDIQFESSLDQLEKQMKVFTKYKVSLILCGKKIKGYKIICKNSNGYVINQIVAHGKINGRNVSIELSSQKELKSNEDIQPLIQEIVRF